MNRDSHLHTVCDFAALGLAFGRCRVLVCVGPRVLRLRQTFDELPAVTTLCGLHMNVEPIGTPEAGSRTPKRTHNTPELDSMFSGLHVSGTGAKTMQ